MLLSNRKGSCFSETTNWKKNNFIYLFIATEIAKPRQNLKFSKSARELWCPKVSQWLISGKRATESMLSWHLNTLSFPVLTA